MKQIATYILGLLILTSCRQPNRKTVNKDSPNVETKNKIENSTIKSSVPVTDSAKLMKHLDSLPKIKFPYKSEFYNRSFSKIDLSDFKK
jgi:hypothetical protein